MTVKLSIIIPVYNAEDSISRCLESVLTQSFQDFEVLLINDGSSDGSINVLNSYANQHPRFRIIDKENEGVAKTRNLGIREAKGRYILFIDNDDFIDEDYLETYYQEAEARQADIVIGGYRRVNRNNHILFQEKLKDSEWSKYIVTAPWAKIYRRDFLLEHNLAFLDYPIGEDIYFNLAAYGKTDKLGVIDYIGYNWYFNTASISNTSQKGFNTAIDITYFFDRLLSVMKKPLNQYDKYFFRRYLVWYLLFSGRESSPDEFMRQYRKLQQWIDSHQLRSTWGPFHPKLSSEKLQTKLSVFAFDLLEKTRLIGLFAKFYCRKS